MPKKDEVSRSRDRILELPDDEVRDLILADYKISQDRRDAVNERNKRYRKMYFQKEDVPTISKLKSPQAKSDGRSHVYLPYARAMFDSALSLVCRILFPQDKFVAIEPTEVDDEKHAEAYEDLFYYRSGRSQMNLKQLFREQFLPQLLMYDCVVGGMGWRLERGYVPKRRSTLKFINLPYWRFPFSRPVYTMEQKNDAIDRPEFYVLDTLRIYPDPAAIDFDDSRFFIYLKDTNLSALRRREKTKDNPNGIWEKLSQIEPNSYPGKEAQTESKQINRDMQEGTAESDEVELMPYHTPDALVVLANRKWVIRRKRMAGYPFTKGTYIQPPNQWEGIGLMEGIEHLQLHINHLFRASMDNNNAINAAITVVTKELLHQVENKNIKLWHGKVLTTAGDPSKAMWRDRPPDITTGIQPRINFLIYMGERLTNISENAQGVARIGGRRTATEASMIAAGLETGIGEIASSIEEKNIADIVYLDYNQEILNLTDPAKFRILGRKGVEFRTADREGILFKGSFDVRPLGSKFFANKVMATSQLLQGVQTTAQVPQLAQITDFKVLHKRMWTALGDKNPEVLLLDNSKTDYRVPPEMENLLLAAGHMLEIGNYDNDQEHIAIHTQAMDTGDYPPENRIPFEAHIEKHNQRIVQMQQSGSMVQQGGQEQGLQQLPEMEGGPRALSEEQNQTMGIPFQDYGGNRVG